MSKTRPEVTSEVMQTVTKVMNCISARALNKKQFQVLLNEPEVLQNLCIKDYKCTTMFNGLAEV